MKPVRFSKHAIARIEIRGTTKEEVVETIRIGSKENAKANKLMSRLNFEFGKEWEGTIYPIKQVAPIYVEEKNEIIVITVYTYYF